MKLSRKDAVLATVAYADVFDYPLTREELETWLIGANTRGSRSGSLAGIRLGRGVCDDNRLLTAQRHHRQRWSLQKWQITKKIGWWLHLIPTLKLVGVTGGLAMNNVRREDDIDLFLITAAGTLWTSRLLVALLLELLGRRRRREQTKVKDLICLNMFMDENYLHLPKNEQDLFSSHEVLQMQPLWERAGTYQKFLQANTWVKKFLPNAWQKKTQSARFKVQNHKLKIKNNNTNLLLIGIEFLAKIIQLWYMRQHRLNEVTSKGVLRFHPADARIWVKKSLSRRLRRYNIPLDKIFYNR